MSSQSIGGRDRRLRRGRRLGSLTAELKGAAARGRGFRYLDLTPGIALRRSGCTTAAGGAILIFHHAIGASLGLAGRHLYLSDLEQSSARVIEAARRALTFRRVAGAIVDRASVETIDQTAIQIWHRRKRERDRKSEVGDAGRCLVVVSRA
jgi:hypothetical protein